MLLVAVVAQIPVRMDVEIHVNHLAENHVRVHVMDSVQPLAQVCHIKNKANHMICLFFAYI